MAKNLILQNLTKLARGIGASHNKWTGTKTNISFLGKGPTKNPLFQSPLAGLESEAQLGPRESVISAVEDAMGYASAGKLNPIQLEALTLNLESLYKIYNPPVLPMASIMDMAPGIRGIRTVKRPPKRVQEITDDMAMIEDPAFMGWKPKIIPPEGKAQGGLAGILEI